MEKLCYKKHKNFTIDSKIIGALLVVFILFFSTSSHSQNEKSITGVVLEKKTQTPAVGATIVEKGTNNGAVTDFDGKFTIDVVSPNAILEVSYLGFATVTISVSGKDNLVIEIEEEQSLLNEVVIVGYGARKKTDVTGAISSIKAESFNQGVMNAPEELLQAKIPGVRVTPSSGEPGAPTTVTIRGAGALRSGDRPLYVVDGIPISNENTSPAGIDVLGANIPATSSALNPIGFLNPSDIASMDVLKDASATAIYGSRGANGVILITTKRAKRGKAEINFDAFTGFASVANKLDLGTAADFGGGSVDTDWQDEVYRSAVTNNYNLNYSAGGEKASILVSLGILDQEGIIKRNDFTRYTARLNTSFLPFKDNKLKIDFNLIFSRTEKNGVPTSNSADTTGELITNTIGALPTRSVLDSNGDFSSGRTNPVGLLESYNDIDLNNRLLSALTSTYRFNTNLSYQVNLAADISNANRQQELLPNNLEGVANNGIYGESILDSRMLLFEHFLSYKFKKDDHDFNFLVGHAFQNFKREGSSRDFIGYVLPISAIDNPANVTTPRNLPEAINTSSSLESFFGRVNYAYGERLDLTASLRADGSSKFADGNKWGVFPAIAASYSLITPNDDKGINSLKARIGWGQTGNQSVPGNPTQDTFAFDQSSGSIGLIPVSEGNPDLEWEISNQFNVGIDFSLLDNRLYGTVDYFNKVNEKSMLFVAKEPPAVTSEWINLPGDITNSGVEVLLGYDIANKEDFSWNISVNGTYITNEVNLGDDQQFLTGALYGPGLNGSFVQVVTSGEQLGSFLLPTANADGTTGEAIIQGSGIPNFIYGINTSLNYKNWDFSMNFSGAGGNKIYNNTAQFVRNAGENVPVNILNETNTIPDGASDYYLEDGDFLRLANTTLGYNFNMPNNNFLSKLRVYLTGQNLFTITDYSGYDPEVNTSNVQGGILSYGIDFASYPRARTLILGLNASF